MIQDSLSPDSPETDLITYLFARREAMLDRWRSVCEQDSILHAISTLSREEFNDLVPTLLNTLEQRLRNSQDEVDPVQIAAEHGLHRWQKGYTLRELLREVKYLNEALLDELRTYWELYPTVDPKTLLSAYQVIAQLTNEIVEGSVARYDELERAAAASRANTLRTALDSVNQLTRQRTDFLRTSSHDLRSSLGIIQGAAFMLDLENQNPEERGRLIDMVNRNLANVQDMLQNLMSLARLDAGQDVPEMSSFDAAQLLNELVQSTQPLAAERNLKLLGSGPQELVVESDALKIRRIVQNLLVNALMYTPSGIVSVTWSKEDDYRWLVSVQDSGPGLPDEVIRAMVSKLSPTHDSTSVFENKPLEKPPTDLSPDAPREPTVARSKGEGIGLHIVKRLCEVLEASLDIETQAGKGTLFRVRFPIRLK